MRYLHVRWLHTEPYEPVEFYFELDDVGWEHRRIEKYIDGRFEKLIGMAEKALPPLEELNAYPDSEAREIAEETFNKLWESLSNV